MPTNSRRINHPVLDRGTAQKIADLEKRVHTLESTVGKIGDGAVGSQQVGTIDGTNNVTAGSITSPSIGAGAITSQAIAAGAIFAGAIATGAISSYLILGNTITLASNTTNSNKVLMDTTGIRAYDGSGVLTLTIAASDGSLTVSKGTITGAVIQTGGNAVGNPSASKVMIDSTGIKAYDANANVKVTIDTSGNFTSSGGTITGGTVRTSSASSAYAIMDSTGLRVYDQNGTNTVNLNAADGSFTMLKGSITLASTPTPGTGARVTLDTSGVKGFNASNTQMFNLDATTGLIQATGVITAQAGSSLPAGTIVGSLPGSANRYSNSSFQNGAGTFDSTGWTFTNGTASNGGTTAAPVYGALTCLVTAAAAGDVVVQVSTNTDQYRRVMPNLNYSFSHYVYPNTTARQSRIDVAWYDINGVLLSTTAGTAQVTTLNAWNRVASTALAPANAAYAVGKHYVGVGAAAAEKFYVDAFQMEMGDRASAWAPRPDEILYAQINANNINVASLSAISANMGQITAGTITGATFQTASGAVQRVVMDSTGVYTTDTDGITKLITLTAGQGFQVPAANAWIPASPTPQIEWKQTSDGTITSGLWGTGFATTYGGASGTDGGLTLAAYSGNKNMFTGTVKIGAYQDPSTFLMRLEIAGSSNGAGGINPGSGGSIDSYISINYLGEAGSEAAFLMTADGRSSFPILTGAGPGDTSPDQGLRNQKIGQPTMAYRNAGFALSTTGWNALPTDTVVHDPSTQMGTGYFVPKWSGYFLVLGEINIYSQSASGVFGAGIQKNSTTVAQGDLLNWWATGQYFTAQVMAIVQANAGDSIQLAYYCNAAANLQAAANYANYLHVFQIA